MNPDPAELPLRDIHLPAPVSWWPPAPGWWLLALALLLASLMVWLWLRHRRRRRWARAALAELETLDAAFRVDGNAHRLCREVSLLLRRIALLDRATPEQAALTGEDWLAWLDRPLDGRMFQTGPGRVLLHGPYDPKIEVDADALVELCRRWIAAFSPERPAA
jgi:hypothetical protein